VRKGEELGWFEHGSTIIVLAPEDFEFCDNVVDSARLKAGQPLMRKAASANACVVDLSGRMEIAAETRQAVRGGKSQLS
jgi:5-deoxy-D-glucuronate isomerase